jgi:hypothetical protein
MRGGVNRAFYGIEAAKIALVFQVGERVVKKSAKTHFAKKWRLEIAFGDSGETESGEGTRQDGVGGGFTDSGAEVGLPLIEQREQFRHGEVISVDDPDVENGVGEVVAKFRVWRREIGAEFLGENEWGLALGDGAFIFGDIAPELAVVAG